jgi:hypothetical protein
VDVLLTGHTHDLRLIYDAARDDGIGEDADTWREDLDVTVSGRATAGRPRGGRASASWTRPP